MKCTLFTPLLKFLKTKKGGHLHNNFIYVASTSEALFFD